MAARLMIEIECQQDLYITGLLGRGAFAGPICCSVIYIDLDVGEEMLMCLTLLLVRSVTTEKLECTSSKSQNMDSVCMMLFEFRNYKTHQSVLRREYTRVTGHAVPRIHQIMFHG